MKKLFLYICLLCTGLVYGTSAAMAQSNITRVEYYIDIDPGPGLATSLAISPGTDLANLTIPIDPGTLTQGVHRLYARAQNADGVWGLVNYWLFYKPYDGLSVPPPAAPADIDLVEYYIDNDPGPGNATSLFITPGANLQDLIIPIDPGTLTQGVHRLYARARNANGYWSLVNFMLFNKPYESISIPPVSPASNINLVEYYLDNDPGLGNGTALSITPGINLQDLIIPIDPAGLTTGVHRLYARARNADGHWGLVNQWLFYKPYASASIPVVSAPSALQRVEYYIDTDPGVGNGIPVAFTPGTDFSDLLVSINIAGLTTGAHKLHLRARNQDGRWSLVNTLEFNIPAAVTSPSIIANAVSLPYLCAGTTMQVSFTATGSFNPGNQFELFLSNENGDFSAETSLATVVSTGLTGTFSFQVPNHLAGGNGYKFRIKASDPLLVGTPTAADFAVSCPFESDPVITLSNKSDVSCFNGTNGAILVNITGGNAPYTFAWTKDGDPLFSNANEDLQNVGAGTYHLTVTTAGGKTATYSNTIQQPAAALSAYIISNHPTCPGVANGNVMAMATGGTLLYSYAWITGAQTATVNNLPEGNYQVTVTDNNGCTAQAQTTLTAQHPLPTPTITPGGPVSICQGETVVLTASAGASYLWSNGATTQSITVGTAGTYLVVVTSAAGCSAPSAGVQVTVNAAPTWYVDNDNDGYGTGASIQACSKPGNAKAAADMLSLTGDCNDNDPNINASKQYFQFSTTPGFTTKVIDLLKGTSYNTFSFEVDYFDVNNQLPLGTYPRVVLDYEGNGIFTNANDRMLSMAPKDASDLTTSDGKRYVVSFSGLPYGTNYQTRILSNDANNCSTTFGPFNYPDVLQEPNLQIFANDIKFTKFRTDLNETITVSADIHNTSDQPAENFVVRMVSQYDAAATFPDQTVRYLAPYGKTTVSWNIVTPPDPAWVPMQVFIDQTNVIAESNELDNNAVRPYVNGDFEVPGNIVTTVNFTPSVTNLCYSNQVTLYGNAYYINTAVALPDPSVAGATVEFTIQETGATYSGYTNSLGNYSISFPAPPPGVYHITGKTTDFTLEDPFIGTFTIINQCPCAGLPNLVISPMTLSSYSILQGGSVTGTVTVKNTGSGPTLVPTELALSLSGGSVLPQTSFVIPPLAAGASTTVNITSLTFNTPGYYTFYANADATQLVAECSEWDNYGNATLEVRPNLPDIRPYNGPYQGTVYNCPNPTTPFTIENIGGVAAGPFDIRVKVRLGASVMGTYIHNCPGIGYGANRFYSFTVPHVYTQAGVYSFDIECDIEVINSGVITELREDNNSASYNNWLTVLDCKPDLVVQNCVTPTVSPVNPAYGGAITLSTRIANIGNATAVAPFTIRFNYSNGTFFDVVHNTNLSAGQSVMVSAPASAPAAPGVTLSITVDPGGSVAELSENNNTAAIGPLCHELQPVPTCIGATFSGTILQYNTATPWVAVRTNGIFRSKDVKVKFEVSGPGIAGTQHLGTMNLASELNICNCPTVIQLNDVFAFNQLGTYTFTFTVDPADEFLECNEGNNVMQTQINVVNYPDMRILSQYINPSKLNPDFDEPVTFDVTYENIGRSNVPDNMKLRVLVDGAYHDEVTVGGLVQNDKNTVSIPAPWSSSIYGAHIIRAIIDHAGQVQEVNELNNEATRAILVGVSSNLTPQILYSTKQAPEEGEDVELRTTIKNEGDLGCSAKAQFFYLDNQGQQVFIGELPFDMDPQEEKELILPWKVILKSTTITVRIVNVSVLEFNSDDNEKSYRLGDFNVVISETSNAPCPGGTGSLTALASGGTGPYTYEWSSLAVGPQFTGTPGTYTITVTDATGQQVTAEGVISALPDNTDPQVVSCPTDINTTNPVVTWTAPVFSDNCSPLDITSTHAPGATFPVGTTTVTYTATDPSGNTATCTFSVTVAPPPYLVTITGTEILTCFGARTGTLTATPTGGHAPYTYLWSNGKKTQTISALLAGTYTVTVTDADLETTYQSHTILQPAKVTGTAIATKVSCFGDTDGKLEVTGAGGTPGYTYSLNGGPYQSSGLFENLAPASYTISIKDANGCTGVARGTVREPALLTANLLNMVPACFGSNTGIIYMTVAGGTNPKTYSWTGPNGFAGSTKNIRKLAPGMYYLTVTDAKGCVAQASVEVTSFNQYFSNAVITNTTCRGGNDGAIQLNPSGGSGSGFAAAWTGPGGFISDQEDLTGLIPGNYRLTLTDLGTGCQLKETHTVGQPPTGPTLSATVTPVATCGGTGSIMASAGNGEAPFQYSLDGGGFQGSGLFTGLLQGSYTLTAKDAKGCTITKSITVTDKGNDLFESNNTRGTAKIINFGQNVVARIGTGTDQDWFKFTTPADGSQYSVTISHPTVTYATLLQTAAGITITPDSEPPGAKNYTLLPNTTYVVQVTGTQSLICYLLQVVNTSPMPGIFTALPVLPDISGNLTAKVYPNPHEGNFIMEVESPANGEGTIILYDLMGRAVSERKETLKAGKNQVRYAQMRQMSYVYRVVLGARSTSGKIISIK